MKRKMSVLELKRSIAELQSSGSALIDVLTRVRDEGRTIADRGNKDVNWKWVEQALANIRAYQKELSEGIRKRDPIVISHAAWKFMSIVKYFEDTSLEWSKLEKDLDDQVSDTAARGGEVGSAIDPFDASSLAEIQRSL